MMDIYAENAALFYFVVRLISFCILYENIVEPKEYVGWFSATPYVDLSVHKYVPTNGHVCVC
jgi:hypothetical protein